MRNNKGEFVDIYSHSGVIEVQRKVKDKESIKSRGILKSILCFLVVFFCFVITVLSYAIGTYIGRNGHIDTVLNNSENISEGSVIVSQDRITPGFKEAMQSIVGICIYNGNAGNYASGVIISDDGYIITNDHIFSGISSPKIKAYDADGNYFDAAFIGADSKTDIAVIKIEKLGLKSAKSYSNASVGQRAYCIGYPLDTSLSLSVTEGIISGLNRRVNSINGEYSPRMLQTDAAINPGNSGGAIVDESGRILGISTSKIGDTAFEGIGFAIPIEEALNVANEIILNGSVYGRAKLGITYTAVDFGKAISAGIPCGICIKSVDILSDLYGRGIGEGDTITAINGKKIRNEDDFLIVIESLKPNDRVSLSITTSNGMTRETEAVLMEDKPEFSYIG